MAPNILNNPSQTSPSPAIDIVPILKISAITLHNPILVIQNRFITIWSMLPNIKSTEKKMDIDRINIFRGMGYRSPWYFLQKVFYCLLRPKKCI